MMRAKFLISAVACLSATVNASDSAPTENARNLVRAMKLGETAVFAAQVGLENSSNSQAKDPAFLDCVYKLEPSDLVDDLAPAIESAMTAKEINQALKFFSRPAGQKYIESAMREFQISVGRKPEQPEPLQTTDEMVEIDTFSRTSAGNKLLVQQILTRPSVSEKARAHMRQTVAECVQRKGTAK